MCRRDGFGHVAQPGAVVGHAGLQHGAGRARTSRRHGNWQSGCRVPASASMLGVAISPPKAPTSVKPQSSASEDDDVGPVRCGGSGQQRDGAGVAGVKAVARSNVAARRRHPPLPVEREGRCRRDPHHAPSAGRGSRCAPAAVSTSARARVRRQRGKAGAQIGKAFCLIFEGALRIVMPHRAEDRTSRPRRRALWHWRSGRGNRLRR